MRILVCGGRDFDDQAWMDMVLDGMHADRPISAIIQGGNVTKRDGRLFGADWQARQWAIARKVRYLTFPAQWKKDGVLDRRAGPRRNSLMLSVGRPDVVVAFPGGRGTADMVQKAKAAGVPVRLQARGG